LGDICAARGTEPLNPRFHEEFVTLCALFYSDEISDEEWALLQVHMAYCDSCRRTFEEYKQITTDVIPMLAASAATESASGPDESAAAFEEAGRRLMDRLDAVPNPQAPSASKKRPWLFMGALAACAIVSVAFAGGYLLRSRSGTQQMSASLPRAAKPSTLAPGIAVNTDDSLALKQTQAEVTRLREQLSALAAQSSHVSSDDGTLRHQLESEQAQRDRIASERDNLSKQLTVATADIQTLRDKLTSAQSNTDQQATTLAVLENKVHSLNVALDESNTALNDRERMLALDKDFLSHDRDIRDLIGARDLYIADIYDTNENGKTAKPFGRLFYTRDRSLAFYGFDLDKQPGLQQSVAFQAWGSGADRQPVNLGLFYQDDNHKRWVVRFNDAKTLARLNMVFVTVEPPGGSKKPTGRQLLRAYLQIQPNHP